MECGMNDFFAFSANGFSAQPEKVGIGTSILVCLVLPGGLLFPTSASAQLNFTTYQYGTSAVTTVTGIRGDNMTGNYSVANSGGDTGGLLFNLSTGAIAPFPSSTSGISNFPGAISSTPYGPSFGSATGILRVGGSYKTAASNPDDLGYLYDGAAAPGAQLTTLLYPGSGTINTLAHSNFGNQVVGNYDTILATGNAFIYDIPSGTFTTNNRPGAVSTTAYGVYGNRIAGGFADPTLHGYIYNQDTGTFTTYNAPGSVVTHFEGITGAGRANTFNLVADSVDIHGNPHAWAVHVDAAGIATWTEIAVPGADVTSANSIYQNKLIGVYVQGGVTRAFVTTVPGIYDPVTNTTSLTTSTPGTAAITGAGDDVANSGSILATGVGSQGINSGTYGVVTNTGSVTATGAGGTAVLMTGRFGSLLNGGTITAAAGANAIGTDGTSVGTLVVNNGIIDGRVAIAAGADARFENSGWMGISAAGAGTAHEISGLFAQTAGGTLSVRASPAVADSLQVDGRAVLGGTVNVAAQAGTYTRNTTYTILNATDGINGTFAGATTNLAFLRPSLSYDAQNVFLSLVTGFAAGAQTGNQRAVGTVLDGVSNTATGDFSTVLNAMANLNTSQGTAALDAISGQAYSGFASANLASGLLYMNAVGQQMGFLHGGSGSGTRVALAEACDAAAADACDLDPTHRWGAWIAGVGGLGSVAGNNGAGTLTYNLGGAAIGADYRFDPRFLAGVSVGYSSGRQWVNGLDGQATTDNFNLSLYGSYTEGAVYVDALVGYGYNDNRMRRNIAIPGLQPRTAQGQTHANQFLGQIEAGYRIGIFAPAALSLTPFARLQASTGTQAGFTETGADSLNLTVAQQTTNALRSTFGVDLGGAIDTGWREKLAFRVRLGWAHEFADTSRPMTGTFAGAPGFGFTVLGAAPQRDSAVLGLGLNTAVAASTSIYVRYDGEVGGSSDNHVFSAGLRMTW